MPFPVKYNSGNVTGSIIKGNVALAVNDIVGPTSVTGWYNGPNFTQGTYQIVETSASGDPEVYCPRNEAELVRFVKSKGALSGVTGSSTDALVWIGTQPNLLAINEVYPNIVTDGDVLNLDAGFAGSYPVDPFQVNLLYNNGVYTPGAGVSGFSSLGLWVTESVIIPNNKFRISTGTVFRQAGQQTLRFYVPLSVLTQYQSYNLSFNYQIISGSLFSMSDWNDNPIFNSVGIDYGTYRYSSSAGTGVFSGAGGLYDNNYRFMDFNFGTSSIVDIWDIQLTQNTSASLFNTGSRTTWYDISGNNDNGSLLNGVTYNNNALVFDGIDDNINIESYISMSNPTTVCALINRSITSSGDQVFFGPSANGSDQWLSISNNVLSLRGTQAEDINNFQIYGNTSISSSRWYFTTGIINGPTSSIYLNGNLERSATQSFNIAGWGGSARIGTRFTTQFPFPGKISNIQAYNKVLTQAEINQNYYQAPIVTDGLVFAADAGNLVSFERGSTTTYSLTGSISGSLVNSTGYTGSNGGSWVFDGIDDYISIPDNPVLDFTGSVNLTSEVWIKFNQYKDISFVNAKGDGGGSVNNYNYFFIGTNTSFYFRFSDGTTSQSSPIITQTNLPTGSWGHVVGVLDTTAIRLYLNGVEIGTATTRTINPKANNSSFLISSPSYALNGSVAASRIYNRALTSQEISQNFNAQKARFGF